MVWPSLSWADASVSGHVQHRTLNGHTFVSAETLGDPFIVGFASSSTGMGAATTHLELGDCEADNDRCIDPLDYKTALLWQQFQLQFQWRQWLAMRLGGRADMVIARDSSSAFQRVMQGDMIGFANIKGRLYANDWVNWGVGLGVAGGEAVDISMSDAFDSLTISLSELDLSTDELPDTESLMSDMLVIEKTVTYSASTQAAVGLHPGVGLLTSATYEYEQDAIAGDMYEHHYLTGQFGISTTLSQWWKLAPVGVVVGVERLFHLNADTAAIDRSRFVAGVNYVGRSYLELGLEYNFSRETLGVDTELVHQLEGGEVLSASDAARLSAEQDAHEVHTRLRVYF